MNIVRRFFSRVDYDDVFAYITAKNVQIRDWRLGFLHLAMTAAFLGPYLYAVVYYASYNSFDTVTGSVKFFLSPPASPIAPSVAPYCNAACRTYALNETGCNCVFWDSRDLVYPEVEPSAAFISTSVNVDGWQRPQQACVAGVCQQSAWGGGVSSGWRQTVGPDVFVISLFHEGLAPQFYQDRLYSSGDTSGSPFLRNSRQLRGHLVDQKGNVLMAFPSTGLLPGAFDSFNVSTLLQAAGVTFDDVRQKPGRLRVQVEYGLCIEIVGPQAPGRDNCNLVPDAGTYIDFYQYQVLYIPDMPFRLKRTSYSRDSLGPLRELRTVDGLRIVFLVSGRVGKLTPAAFLITLRSVVLMVTIASFIVNALVLHIIPGHQLYRNAKFEVSRNFHDLRAMLAKENDLRLRLNAINQMVLFQATADVERTVDKMKPGLPEGGYEALLLKCIDVYGTQLLDNRSADLFFDKLETGQGRIKAYLILGQLKEAYVLAARTDAVDQVQAVRQAAATAGNERVQQLCDQFLELRTT